MAFQKFKMHKDADFGKRKKDKSQDLWRKKQRVMKDVRRG